MNSGEHNCTGAGSIEPAIQQLSRAVDTADVATLERLMAEIAAGMRRIAQESRERHRVALAKLDAIESRREERHRELCELLADDADADWWKE